MLNDHCDFLLVLQVHVIYIFFHCLYNSKVFVVTLVQIGLRKWKEQSGGSSLQYYLQKNYDLSKLFYKIEMSFAEFQHKLGGPDKCLKCQKA